MQLIFLLEPHCWLAWENQGHIFKSQCEGRKNFIGFFCYGFSEDKN